MEWNKKGMLLKWRESFKTKQKTTHTNPNHKQKNKKKGEKISNS